MKRPQWMEFPDRETLASVLADRICSLLADAIAQRGIASLAVSGGSTPVSLFNALSRRKLAWDKVVVTLVDERWVEPTDADSNERLVHLHLLQDRAAAARLIGMKTNDSGAEEGENACTKRLQKVPRPFDVLVLGMGNDGHTASLFPGAARLAEATDMDSGSTCMAIVPREAPHARMTLTLPAILDSRQIFLHITGEKKKQVYEQALADGPAEEMPIRYILRQQQVPVSVYCAP